MSAAASAGPLRAPARAVADAVLYEGYVLYPYRASAAKNQLRWQFGVLTPPAFAPPRPPAPSAAPMRTECLRPGRSGHPTPRSGSVPSGPAPGRRGRRGGRLADGSSPVATLEVGGRALPGRGTRAIEHVIDLPPFRAPRRMREPYEPGVPFPAGGSATELLRSKDGRVAGRLVRRRRPVEGCVTVAISVPDGGAPLRQSGRGGGQSHRVRAAGHPAAASDRR